MYFLLSVSAKIAMLVQIIESQALVLKKKKNLSGTLSIVSHNKPANLGWCVL